MDLKITRDIPDQDGCFGELKRQDTLEVVAHSAERTYQQDDGTWSPKIPAGTYTCQRSMHRLHGMTADFETFQIMDVPGHTNVLIHWANWPQIDLDGCVGVGEAKAPSSKGPMITNSRVVWQELMDLQKGLDTFQLIVED